MEELIKVFKNLTSTIGDLDKGINNASKNTVTYQEHLDDLKSGFDDIQKAVEKTSDAFKPLGEAISKTIEPHVKKAKDSFGKLAESANKRYEEATKRITDFSSRVNEKYEKVLKSINSRTQVIFSKIQNRFSDLSKITKPYIDDFKENLITFARVANKNFNVVAKSVENLGNKIKSSFRKAYTIIDFRTQKVSKYIQEKFSILSNKLKPHIDKIKNGLNTIADTAKKKYNLASKTIIDFASKVNKKYVETLTKVQKRINSFTKFLPSKSQIQDIVETFGSGIKKIANSSVNIIKKGLGDLGNAAKSRLNSVSNLLKTAAINLVILSEKTSKKLQLLGNALKTVGGRLVSLANKALGAAKKAASAVKKVLQSPFKLIKTVVEKYGKFKEKYEAFQKKYAVPSLNFKGVKGKLKSAYDSVSKFVKKFGDKKKLDNLNKLYKKEFSRITSVFKPVANKLIDFATEFVKGFKTISKAAEPIISMIVNLAGTIGGFLRAMFGLKEGTSAAAGAISIFKKVLDFLVTPISYIALGLNTLFEVLKPAAPIIGAVAGAWLIWNIIMGLSPITWIVLGIVALIAVIAVVIKYTKGWATAWQGFKDILSAVWSQLKENFSFFIDSIVYGFQKAWYNVVDFGQRAIQYVKNVGAAIKLAWDGDFSGARAKLNEKITTEAEVKLKKIEEERQQRVNDFKQKTASNALQVLNGVKKMGSLSFDSKGLKSDLKKMQKGFKFPDKAPNSSTTNNTTTQGINNITDGGKKQTHINVHFDRLIENMVIQSQNLEEGTNEMEDAVTVSLLRVLNSINHMQTNDIA
ncbi:hypothetical protein [Tenacibaculum jejuense]|uniref:Uncharacterized protein n=1 Tax=Tenacibaculum jejuense TaxID=584609 RepID=A0A238UBR2_9FLAO|nr:hypothetical protein [Tenacibaculum jejuense]SNR16532.1 membrane protein of unknown function [Tenacibaculum jejuense]